MSIPRRLPVALVAVVLWVALALPAAADKKKQPPPDSGPSKAEIDGLRMVAKEWITLGKWCVGKKLGTQAKRAAELAGGACPDAEGLGACRDSASTCEDAATEGDSQAYEKTASSAHKKIAGLYEKLYRLGEKETNVTAQERFEGYLWSALELEPSEKRWALVATLANQAIAGKMQAKAARLAGKGLSMQPPGNLVPVLKKALDAAATDGLVLMTTTSHPMKYYLSLPRNFARQKDRKWPILVCVDGAGSNFEGMGRGYQNKRGSLPFLIASPCTFANTNQIEGEMLEKYRKYYPDPVIEEGRGRRIDWDEQGILAMIEDLCRDFDGEERIYITGFSGGGQATYMMTFRHPDRVAGSAPACGNFADFGFSGLKGKFTGDALNFPVHQITGEKDPHREFTHGNQASPGIEPQTDAAERLLRDFGYPNVKRTMVPGLGHSAAQEQVIATFKPYWEGTRKRSDPQD